MRVPDDPITFHDLVRGEVTFEADHVPDFVIVRGNGEPLYTLVNPVDDSLMEITHVLRGEDLLPSTPRQIVRLPGARTQLGIGERRGCRSSATCRPCWARATDGCPSGTRDPVWPSTWSRATCPQALLNYLALLGWAIADDRDMFTLEEMVEAFDILRVNANPARFDPKKCEAINASHIRLLTTDELTDRLVPFFVAAGLVGDPPLPDERRCWPAATPLVQERIQTLSEAVDLLGVPVHRRRRRWSIDPAAALPADAGAGAGRGDGRRWARSSRSSTPRSRPRCGAALIDGLGLKPKLAFGPVRAAVTGQRISPPLFESLELLGRESALARIAAAPGRPVARPDVAKERSADAASGNPRRPGVGPGPGQADVGAPRSSAIRSRALRPPAARGAAARTAPPYPQILRGASYVWWRSLLGVVCGLSLYLLMTAVVTQVVLGVSWGAVGAAGVVHGLHPARARLRDPGRDDRREPRHRDPDPICWVLMVIVHQVRPRWLSSVQPRLRWRYLLICAGVALVVLNAVTLIPLALGSTASRSAPQAGFWGFLVVIVLTSPLQAAAEEIFFRGYLMQALGSLVAHAVVRRGGLGAGLRADARGAEPGPVRRPARPSGCWPRCWSGGPAVSRPASPRTWSTTSART